MTQEEFDSLKQGNRIKYIGASDNQTNTFVVSAIGEDRISVVAKGKFSSLRKEYVLANLTVCRGDDGR